MGSRFTRAWGIAFVALGCGARSSAELAPPSAGVDAEALSYGAVACGSSGPKLTVRLTHPALHGDGVQSLRWAATATGPFEVLGQATGALEALDSVAIQARPLPVVAAHAGDVITGNLHIETNAPEHPAFDIPLQLTSTGGELTYADILDFGEVPYSQQDLGVDFRNAGDVPIDVTLGDPTNAAFIHTKGTLPTVTVKAGSIRSHAYSFRPTKPGLQSATVAVSVSGPLCGSPPKALGLRGSGVVGDARLSATQLDFGLVNCGSQAGPKTIDLTNVGNAPFTYNAATGSAFSVSPTSGLLDPKATVTLEVTPAPVVPPVPVFANSLGSTLTVTTSLPSDLPHVVDLRETPRGGVLALPATADFGRVATNQLGSLVLQAVNTGNAPLDVATSANLGSVGDFGLLGIIPANGVSTPLQLTSHVGIDGLGVDVQASISITTRNQTYLCNVPQLVAHERGYGRAANAAANAQLTCATATTYDDVYCSGTNDVQVASVTQIPTGTFSIARAVPAHAWDVTVGPHSLCLRSTGWHCGFKEGSTNFTATLPPWGDAWETVGSPFVACVMGTDLQCVGRNTNGAWGTGSLAPVLALAPTVAMTGLVPSHFAASSTAGYAVQGGAVYAAGTKSGGNLGTSSVPDGLVLSPVLVDVVSDAKSVSPFEGGACALRTSGAVSCWDTTHATPTDRGAFVDAVEIAASGYDDVCVRRQSGVVSCWNGTTVTNVAGLHQPVRRLIGQGAIKLVVDGEYAVARLGSSIVWMNGFEGP